MMIHLENLLGHLWKMPFIFHLQERPTGRFLERQNVEQKATQMINFLGGFTRKPFWKSKLNGLEPKRPLLYALMLHVRNLYLHLP